MLFDTDGSGLIESNDLTSVMRALGLDTRM